MKLSWNLIKEYAYGKYSGNNHPGIKGVTATIVISPTNKASILDEIIGERAAFDLRVKKTLVAAVQGGYITQKELDSLLTGCFIQAYNDIETLVYNNRMKNLKLFTTDPPPTPTKPKALNKKEQAKVDRAIKIHRKLKEVQ